MPDLLGIVGWILFGLVQLVLYWLPAVRPRPITFGPPIRWWFYNTSDDWYRHLDSSKIPDEHWIHQWLEMAFGDLRRLAVDEAEEAIGRLRSFLLDRVGSIRSGFTSLGSWLDRVWNMIGGSVPAWAGNVRFGLDWLRSRLPASIVSGWDSWSKLIGRYIDVVYDWVMSRYDRFRDFARDAREWISGIGRRLDDWVGSVRGWIERFRSDPAGYVRELLGGAWSWLLTVRADSLAWVTGLLGDDWRALVAFRRSVLQFYLDLWSRGRENLAAFISDPLEFLITRLEQAVMDRW